MWRPIFKRLYGAIPAKPFFFKWLRLLPLPTWLTQHLHFQGVFQVEIDSSSSFRLAHDGFQVENEIFWHGLYGHWEKKSLEIWTRLARDASVVFDIGANTGVYSLVAKSVNPTAAVYAFEPVERVHERLLRNCCLNRYDIRCEPVALSNYNGKATIYLEKSAEPHGHTYCVTVNKNLNDAGVEVYTVTVPTLRLETYLSQHHLERIDLMKIDVETHEPEVLEGLGDLLAQLRPTLLIEILDEETAARVERCVHNLGYLYYDIDDIKGEVRRKDSISRSSHWNYLLCQPAVADRLNLESLT